MVMKAVSLKSFGPAENMFIGEVVKPKITLPTDILVKIKATAINRADVLQRKGNYNPPPGSSDILGLEMSGVVEEVGTEVGGWKPGDRVMALLTGGGYSQYVVIHHRTAIKIPDSMDFITAGAIPEAYLTAYQTLFTIANVQPNQKVLIHAGASGVGTSAIQLCNLVPGVEVYVTAGSDQKIEECVKLGAKGGVNYKEGEWYSKMHKLTGGVDIVLDCVGANYWGDNLNILKLDGKLIMIGFLSGASVSNANLGPILAKRLTIHGTTLRSRSQEYKINLTESFVAFTAGKLGTLLKPVISQVFNWSQVVDAHKLMESNQNVGKIVLKIDEE